MSWLGAAIAFGVVMLVAVVAILLRYTLRQRTQMHLATGTLPRNPIRGVRQSSGDRHSHSQLSLDQEHFHRLQFRAARGGRGTIVASREITSTTVTIATSAAAASAALASTHRLTEPESMNIRLLRHRRWTSRHGNGGITMEELDLVAPVRSYMRGRKRGAAFRDPGDEDDGGNDLKSVNGTSRNLADSQDGEFDTLSDSGTGHDDAKLSRRAVPDIAFAAKHHDQSPSIATDDTCPVCLEEMTIGCKTRVLRCGHEFDARCIEEWITKANRCPVCNMEPLEPDLIARRRNARSTTRRGIDATIVQQRRRRTRGPSGRYELRTIALDENDTDGHVNRSGDERPNASIDETCADGRLTMDLAMPRTFAPDSSSAEHAQLTEVGHDRSERAPRTVEMLN